MLCRMLEEHVLQRLSVLSQVSHSVYDPELDRALAILHLRAAEPVSL